MERKLPNLKIPTLPRHDNFLKSGSKKFKRAKSLCLSNVLNLFFVDPFNSRSGNLTKKSTFLTSTITKEQYLKQNAQLDGMLLNLDGS